LKTGWEIIRSSYGTTTILSLLNLFRGLIFGGFASLRLALFSHGSLILDEAFIWN
jgi:hypothetical protein